MAASIWLGSPYYDFSTTLKDKYLEKTSAILRKRKDYLDLKLEINIKECFASEHIYNLLRKWEYPIDIRNVPEFLMSTFETDEGTSYSIHFCKLYNSDKMSKRVILYLENIDDKYDDVRQKLKEKFSHEFTTVSPVGCTVKYGLLNLPIKSHLRHLFNEGELSNFRSAIKNADSKVCDHPYLSFAKMKPHKVESLQWLRHERQNKKILKAPMGANAACDFPDRLHYLLSDGDLKEGFVTNVDIKSNPKLFSHYFVLPHVSRAEMTSLSPLIGIDCEFLNINEEYHLTRVAVVNEKFKCIYDALFKQPSVDYKARFPDASDEMIKSMRFSYSEIHKELSEVIPKNAIIVGHSPYFDFKALKIYYPYVIDTAAIYRKRNTDHMAKLRISSFNLLGKSIQTARHNPFEDAIAAMELALMKIKCGPDFYIQNNQSNLLAVSVPHLLKKLHKTCEVLKDPSSEEFETAVAKNDVIFVISNTLKYKIVKKLYKRLPANSLFMVCHTKDSNISLEKARFARIYADIIK